jgi:hydrogen peroxide-dependent heme synthase
MNQSEPIQKPPLPAVPLTADGSSLLHQMFRVDWSGWRELDESEQREIVEEAAGVLGAMEVRGSGESACYSLLGGKGDLLLVHFREDFEKLLEAELEIGKLRLSEFLEMDDSFLSVVELGLYESSAKLYTRLEQEGVEPFTEGWNKAAEETLATQARAMAPRLHPRVPAARYICFYPMDRKRGEAKNWYMERMEDRRRMMHDHGMIGRRYAGEVKQIISGSIGFDDWEWGVDLFADDPKIFKKLIYEMRFDEVSAVYALFGPFFVGLRCSASQLGAYLDGHVPEWQGKLGG